LKREICLAIIGRKKGVAIVALALAIVMTVSTSLIVGAETLKHAPEIAEKIVGKKEKFVPTTSESGVVGIHCVGRIIRPHNNYTIPILISLKKQTIITIQPPKEGNASMGYLLSRTINIKKNQILKVEINNKTYQIKIGSFFISSTIFDAGIVIWKPLPCNGTKMTLKKEGLSRYSSAFTEQVRSLINLWRISLLIILTIGAITASIKAYKDIEKESIILEETGIEDNCIKISLSIIFIISILGGYAWGWILSGILDSLAGTLSNIYIPTPKLSLYNFLINGIIPSIVIGIISIIVGVLRNVSEQ